MSERLFEAMSAGDEEAVRELRPPSKELAHGLLVTARYGLE